MTFASDRNLHDMGLSATARRMLALRDVVLAEWEKRLRSTVREAAGLPHPILINTFPSLYDNIAEAISPGYPRENAAASNTVASEHGGERARLTDYSHQAVIAEYQLLRWTLLDVLRQHGVSLNSQEFHDINASIDACMRESVNAFALAQSALRERFIITVAHDLRNPLQVISSAAELLLHARDPGRIGTLAERIFNNSQRMDRMIQDLLDAAVFQSGERRRLHLSCFDIMETVREVCDQLVEVYGPRFEIVGEPVEGWWDRDALKRVVENLVGNALKYGKPQAPIRIMTASQHERMLLTVHNDGEPIPAEQLETVFQVFRRAEAAKEGEERGWGIGLPYVRSVAESHGGSVQIDSAAGRGTTLSINIPVDARPFQDAPTLGR
ncbi:sensor histidine kinase [Noviherbaspirillum soli]|uniref:sensor histidine kinase n=1 Tax=Noviherbaspirillum soli TaxID=1064518 RepID=UPI00188C701A|nr:HAMP domain-containing sensor histidine kinase [Noviherbaspirillum soli]